MKKNNLPFGLFILTIAVTGKWPKTAATIKVDKIEQTEEGVYLMEDHLNTLEQTLDANEKAIAAHGPALKAANDAKATAEGKVADLTAQLDKAKTDLSAATAKLTAADEKIVKLEAKITGRATEKEDPNATGAEGAAEKPKYSWTKAKFKNKK